MGHVSGVTLFCSVSESEGDDDAQDAGEPVLTALNEYLARNGDAGQFTQLAESYGGPKHPQQLVFAAGLNYFDEDAFAAFVLAYPWERPGRVVLVIQPEHGPTRVWRPELQGEEE